VRTGAYAMEEQCQKGHAEVKVLKVKKKYDF
jgi:hypothetical protein